ncbi:hypothetical protein PS3A_25240 [Pseudomonas sp. 3A(2025)]
MSIPPEDDVLKHAVGHSVAELDFADVHDFSRPWEAAPGAPDLTGAKAPTGNEYRKSLKLYADCVTVNRRYIAAYQL